MFIFQEMDTCGGIDRLFDIYTHTRDKLTERNCAVCIGMISIKYLLIHYLSFKKN